MDGNFFICENITSAIYEIRYSYNEKPTEIIYAYFGIALI